MARLGLRVCWGAVVGPPEPSSSQPVVCTAAGAAASGGPEALRHPAQVTLPALLPWGFLLVLA